MNTRFALRFVTSEQLPFQVANTKVDSPEHQYLVHALRDELPLAVDAGEGAVPRHLLQSVGNVSWRRRAAVC